jgi:hypothetical protein
MDDTSAVSTDSIEQIEKATNLQLASLNWAIAIISIEEGNNHWIKQAQIKTLLSLINFFLTT